MKKNRPNFTKFKNFVKERSKSYTLINHYRKVVSRHRTHAEKEHIIYGMA